MRLTPEQARALSSAGERLAGDSSWWGHTDDEPTRSVIECTPASAGEWAVRVIDAIGLIVVDDLQLVVQPKIPLAHLLYLLEIAGYIPRVSHKLGAADVDQSLWRLVARWYVGATEQVLRRDLLRDYHAERDELPAARGQVVAVGTARAYYAGRLSFECRYEEFGLDSPLNRVLKGAAQVIAGSSILDLELRRRAFRLLARMESVGALQDHDVRTQTDRHSHYYREAFGWARHVLLARGRTLSVARSDARIFLIRTPEAVEVGIRKILQERIGRATIAKRGKRLEGTYLTINPDLVVGEDIAVADVKYKLSGNDWNRTDLYQLVTFATGFRSRYGGLISFQPPTSEALSVLNVGDVHVTHLPWPADPSLSCEDAAEAFTLHVRAWLDAGPLVTARGVRRLWGAASRVGEQSS